MSEELHGPTSHYYVSQRLRLHYVDWGNAQAPPMLLVHGGRDHCRNWDWVARELREAYHIIAPDLRGHGDSEWVVGTNYAMVDYVYDVAQLIHQMKLQNVTIVAHSLGGSISVQYAGVFPANVRKLVSIEGLGPPPNMIAARANQPAYERMREWIDAGRRMAGRQPRRYATLEDAVRRMQEENPHLSADQAHHLTSHGVNQNEDGSYSWKFDNYVRGHSPYSFNLEEAHQFWERITCPTLLVRGGESWAGDPDKDGRLAHFEDARSVTIPNAGHWVHHDQLELFLAQTRSFLKD